MGDTPLLPKLRPLDRAVLDELGEHGRRVSAVAGAVLGEPWWRCTKCGREQPADNVSSWAWHRGRRTRCYDCCKRDGWTDERTMVAFRRALPDDIKTVREILRGLERFELAWQRNGWWRASPLTYAGCSVVTDERMPAGAVAAVGAGVAVSWLPTARGGHG